MVAKKCVEAYFVRWCRDAVVVNLSCIVVYQKTAQRRYDDAFMLGEKCFYMLCYCFHVCKDRYIILSRNAIP